MKILSGRLQLELLIGVSVTYFYFYCFNDTGLLLASSLTHKNSTHPSHTDDSSRIRYADEPFHSYCIANRGTSGSWYPHPSMGQQTFYTSGYRSSKWHRANGNNHSAVYEGNMFAWNDTTTFGRHGCRPIAPVTKASFCHVMRRLEIRRLLLVGDSLMDSQLDSLVSLVGYNYCHFKKCRKNAQITKDSIDCDKTSSDEAFSVRVVLYRENLGANLRTTDVTGREDAIEKSNFPGEIPYCIDGPGNQSEALISPWHYCPWHNVYKSTTDKTLLILNQGAHFHSVDTFAKSMDLFVASFNAIGHKDDILVFRNTVPGHHRCFDADGVIPVPQMTHDAFLRRYYTTKYDWNLFDTYNHIAKENLHHIRSDVLVHYLNVYNMTVLRPDSHWAGNDCLHYSLPGPIDFWNHLLFTNLADLAENMLQ